MVFNKTIFYTPCLYYKAQVKSTTYIRREKMQKENRQRKTNPSFLTQNKWWNQRKVDYPNKQSNYKDMGKVVNLALEV